MLMRAVRAVQCSKLRWQVTLAASLAPLLALAVVAVATSTVSLLRLRCFARIEVVCVCTDLASAFRGGVTFGFDDEDDDQDFGMAAMDAEDEAAAREAFLRDMALAAESSDSNRIEELDDDEDIEVARAASLLALRLSGRVCCACVGCSRCGRGHCGE